MEGFWFWNRRLILLEKGRLVCMLLSLHMKLLSGFMPEWWSSFEPLCLMLLQFLILQSIIFNHMNYFILTITDHGLISLHSSTAKDTSPLPVLDVSSLSTPRKLLDSSQFSTPGSGGTVLRSYLTGKNGEKLEKNKGGALGKKIKRANDREDKEKQMRILRAC